MANEPFGQPEPPRMAESRAADAPTVNFPNLIGWDDLLTRVKAKSQTSVLASPSFVSMYVGFVLILFNRPLADFLGISSRFSLLLGILAFVPIIISRLSVPMAARLKLTKVTHYEDIEAAAKAERDKAIDDIKGTGDLPGLMLANKKQMDAYEALVRSQGESSHRASLVALAATLLVVGAGLLVALVSEDSATKYSAAAMAAAGAATCGFIARNFIRAQQRAQDQMHSYLQQPLVQSYLLTAERIIGMMSNDSKDEQYKLILQSALAQTEHVPHLDNVDGLNSPARRLPKMKLRGVAGGGEG
jgi:hypothetical protein